MDANTYRRELVRVAVEAIKSVEVSMLPRHVEERPDDQLFGDVQEVLGVLHDLQSAFHFAEDVP